MVATAERSQAQVLDVLRAIPDPEIPAISIVDLGIVRAVHVEGGTVEVVITPTYSGCPATQLIEQEVRRGLDAAGMADARIRTSLAPAWTTDWMTPGGREKLRRFGIAPPGERAAAATVKFHARHAADVACPQCGSRNTERLAEFGSTACKALYRCRDCREPFDYFKPI